MNLLDAVAEAQKRENAGDGTYLLVRRGGKRYYSLDDAMSLLSIRDLATPDWEIERSAFFRDHGDRKLYLDEIRTWACIGLREAKAALDAANWDKARAKRYLKYGSISAEGENEERVAKPKLP